jgi:hypothetical protein
MDISAPSDEKLLENKMNKNIDNTMNKNTEKRYVMSICTTNKHEIV